MIIWLLALVLLVCLAAVGYQQGAIRAGVSFIGIVLAAVLALPLAGLIKPILLALGMTNPVFIGALAPFIVFVIILSALKVGGLAIHKKVDVYYKYKAGDLRLALWERLNAQLGACLGLLNALAYLVLISWVAFAVSYWTTQLATGAEDPRTLRFVNWLGRDLDSTGMAKVARAIDPLPQVYYEAADMAGLLFKNSLLEARLSRYPALLPLAERPEFQTLAQDKTFSEMRLSSKPIREVLAHPSVAPIVNDPAELKLIWSALSPDLKDLAGFLETGKSEKYTEKLLGRWFFDANASIVAYRKTKQSMPSTEMAKIRRTLSSMYSKASLVAMPDGTLAVKNFPQSKTPNPGAPETQTVQGHWKSVGNEYELNLAGSARRGKFETGRLVVTGEGPTLVFTPED